MPEGLDWPIAALRAPAEALVVEPSAAGVSPPIGVLRGSGRGLRPDALGDTPVIGRNGHFHPSAAAGNDGQHRRACRPGLDHADNAN